MTDPEKGALNATEAINANEKVTGGAKPIEGNSRLKQISAGNRSKADERRFQDALEDDAVREALGVLHDRKR